MKLNQAGDMINMEWNKLSNRFAFLRLGSHVIMPNHIHGILEISPVAREMIKGDHKDRPYTGMGDQSPHPKPASPRRGEPGVRPPSVADDDRLQASGTEPNSLGRVIQAFKSITTVRYIKNVRNSGWRGFHRRLWQRNYFDRVIRSRGELQRLSNYIRENPIRWEKDTFYVVQ